MSLFEASEAANRRTAQPLAARMWPRSLAEFVGYPNSRETVYRIVYKWGVVYN
jgi:hypothetical protein